MFGSGRQATDTTILDLVPHLLIGVEFRRITGQQEDAQAALGGGGKLPDRFGAVHRMAVQDEEASTAGRLEQARADLHTAQLNLGYTKIYAPVTGVIGRKTVELGHRVQPGQSLMVIVPLDDTWITANFKETQLKRMKPGQPVTVRVDTYDRDYKGTVESLPGAAGPLFSLSG